MAGSGHTDGGQDGPVLVQGRRADPTPQHSGNGQRAVRQRPGRLCHGLRAADEQLHALLPINVSGMFVGDVTQRKEMGGALSVIMMILMVCAILINNAITSTEARRVRDERKHGCGHFHHAGHDLSADPAVCDRRLLRV